MKKLIKLVICSIIISTLTSCLERGKQVVYPQYSLVTFSEVPDSLKADHREWVKETVRAANQNLTAGDYEDIDDTIEEVMRTSESLFSVETITLRKKLGEGDFEYTDLNPKELTIKEKVILKNLKLK